MSQAPHHHKRWQIRRTFAPNRFASMHLAKAYQQIVPNHVRVLPQAHPELQGRNGRVLRFGQQTRRAA